MYVCPAMTITHDALTRLCSGLSPLLSRYPEREILLLNYASNRSTITITQFGSEKLGNNGHWPRLCGQGPCNGRRWEAGAYVSVLIFSYLIIETLVCLKHLTHFTQRRIQRSGKCCVESRFQCRPDWPRLRDWSGRTDALQWRGWLGRGSAL